MNDAVKLPVEIHRCVVVSVDREAHTCNLVTLDDASRRFEGVPWATPLADRFGNGLDIGPDANYICYAVTRTSNMQSDLDDSSVIIAWEAPSTTEATYGKDREVLGAGDVKLSTRRGGRLLLAANSGDVMLQSGPANSIIMYRLANLMEVLCDALHIDTLGGQVRWGTLGEGGDEDDVLYDCHVKSKVGDEAGFFRFYIGPGSEGDIAHLRVMEPTLTAGSYEANDPSDMRGTPSVHVDVKMTRSGTLTVHARERISLSATSSIRVATEGELSAECSNLSIDIHNDAVTHRGTIRANSSSLTSSHNQIELQTMDFRVVDRATGDTVIRTASPDIVEGRNKRLLTEDLVQWIFNHTHPTNNGPTLAPLGSPADASTAEQQSPGSAASAVQASESAAKDRHTANSVVSFTLSHLILALKNNPATAVITETLAQSLVAAGVLDAGSTADTLVQVLNDSGAASLNDAAMIDAHSAVELVNGEVTLTQQEFGVESSAEIMTQETKVR